ncbi:hypothetical protein [Streptomyces sp. NBC_00466]|uniref:hypothetical protein n=1 Tax=Streptomyces sp. NBC_00466 TaxID=2903655 RepID=UPI00352D4FE4
MTDADRGAQAAQAQVTGGTHISFTYRWVHAPLAERLLAPAVRTMMRRANRTAMRRLATELAHHVPATGS